MKTITYAEKRFFEWHEDEVSVSLRAKSGSYGGGSEVLIVCGDDMSYQNVTGCLSQGAHPGSYNGQDAYNDMLVTEDGIHISSNRNIRRNRSCINHQREGSQGCNRSDSRGGGLMNEPAMMSNKKGHNGITEDGTATTLNAQDKERPLVGGGDAMTSVVRRLTPLE